MRGRLTSCTNEPQRHNEPLHTELSPQLSSASSSHGVLNVSLRRGLCIWLLYTGGCLLWSASAVCSATYFLYSWPLFPSRLAAGLILGGVFMTSAVAVARQEVLSTLLEMIYCASAMASILLVFIIVRVRMSQGFNTVNLVAIVFLFTAVIIAVSYYIRYGWKSEKQ